MKCFCRNLQGRIENKKYGMELQKLLFNKISKVTDCYTVANRQHLVTLSESEKEHEVT